MKIGTQTIWLQNLLLSSILPFHFKCYCNNQEIQKDSA